MQRLMEIIAEEATVAIGMKDLPDSLKKAVKAEVGNGRPRITVVPSERFKGTYDPNNVMEKIILVDINTGKNLPLPFGGKFGEFHDIDQPIPSGGAVVVINFYGGGGASVRIYVNPATMAKSLPEPSTGLSDTEVIVLRITSGLKSSARKEYMDRVAGAEEAKTKLMDGGYLNKAGAVTLKGENYLSGLTDAEKKRLGDVVAKSIGRHMSFY
jgi:hypothetical protein